MTLSDVVSRVHSTPYLQNEKLYISMSQKHFDQFCTLMGHQEFLISFQSGSRMSSSYSIHLLTMCNREILLLCSVVATLNPTHFVSKLFLKIYLTLLLFRASCRLQKDSPTHLLACDLHVIRLGRNVLHPGQLNVFVRYSIKERNALTNQRPSLWKFNTIQLLLQSWTAPFSLKQHLLQTYCDHCIWKNGSILCI